MIQINCERSFSVHKGETDSWLRDPKQVDEKLRQLATQIVPVAVALRVAAEIREQVGNVDIMPKGIHTQSTLDDLIRAFGERLGQERERIVSSLSPATIDGVARSEYGRLQEAITHGDGSWKIDIPGRIVFNRFAHIAQMKPGRLKALYLRKAQELHQDPFSEIRDIFRSFRRIQPLIPQ